MYKKVFIEWYENIFKGTQLYEDMKNTVEDSKWHREANVAIHTDMVVQEYIKLAPNTWSKKDFVGAIQCTIHDIGKPSSEETKERDGKTSRTYYNHELKSQRMFYDYILGGNDKELALYLDVDSLYNIGFIAQHHLPYKLSDKKLIPIVEHLIKQDILDIFLRCIEADNKGRIGDEDTSQQVIEFKEKVLRLAGNFKDFKKDTNNEVVILIGPTGVGKSSYIKEIYKDFEVHSMDTLRTEWYGEDYSLAFKKSCEDKEFASKVNKHFSNLVKAGKNILVDNTNLVSKYRNKYLNVPKDYKKTAIVFLTSYEQNLKQLLNRTDKHIPKEVLDRMYWQLSLPNLSDFDEVEFIIRHD